MGVRRTETALIVWAGPASAPASIASGEVAAASAVYPFEADQRFDAGDKGCGEGPLDTIAGLLRKMQPGQTLAIRATDPSVAVDLAAWSRMAGHQLVDQQGSYYLIRHG